MDLEKHPCDFKTRKEIYERLKGKKIEEIYQCLGEKNIEPDNFSNFQNYYRDNEKNLNSFKMIKNLKFGGVGHSKESKFIFIFFKF
jgi:hypothetical protein